MKVILSIKTVFMTAVFLTAVVLCGCADDLPPTIKYGEFPFHFMYELNGEVYDIVDTVVCRYRGFFFFFSFRKVRSWKVYLKSTNEPPYIFFFRDPTEYGVSYGIRELNARVSIYFGGEYYMGEPKAKKPFSISCYNERNERKSLTEKQLEEYFGVKIIKSEFSKPIDNVFK
jgi:hypothetical protein